MEMEGELQLMREGPGGASEDEGSSSDDSSSSDFEDISSEDAAAVMRLEAELEQNPNLYDSHLQVRCRPPSFITLRMNIIRLTCVRHVSTRASRRCLC
jgi:hypothetical protein